MPRAKNHSKSTDAVAPKKRVAAPKKSVATCSKAVPINTSKSYSSSSSSSSSTESSESPLRNTEKRKNSSTKEAPIVEETLTSSPPLLQMIATRTDHKHLLSTISSSSQLSKTVANKVEVNSTTSSQRILRSHYDNKFLWVRLYLEMFKEGGGRKPTPKLGQNNQHFITADPIMLCKMIKDINNLETLKELVLFAIEEAGVKLDLQLVDMDHFIPTPIFIREDPLSHDEVPKPVNLIPLRPMEGIPFKERLLKSSAKNESKVILDLWVYCRVLPRDIIHNNNNNNNNNNNKRVKITTPEPVPVDSLSMRINLYPLIEKVKVGVYQLPTARKTQTVIKTFTLKPVNEEKISLTFLRAVVGNVYRSLTKDIGEESKLFILPDTNSSKGKAICTDEVLWDTIEELRKNKDAQEIHVHITMGKKLSDDAMWEKVMDNFDPEDDDCIADMLTKIDHNKTGSNSPCMVSTNKTRRIESRESFGNVSSRVTKWLKTVLKKQDSCLYHSMTYPQYMTSLQFLTVKKVDSLYIFDRYTLDDNDPETWPETLSDVFGDSWRQIFDGCGKPEKNSCSLDDDGLPTQKMGTKLNENGTMESSMDKLINIATLSILRQQGVLSSNAQGSICEKSVLRKSAKYIWNFVRAHDSFLASILVDEKNIDDNMTIKQFITTRMDDNLANVFRPKACDKILLDSKDAIAQIIVGKGDNSPKFCLNVFSEMKMLDIIEMTQYSDATFFFKVELISKPDDNLCKSLF